MSSSPSHLSRAALAVTLLCVLAGAAVGAWANIYRLALFTTVAIVEPGATTFTRLTPGARHHRVGGTHALVAMRLPAWRPLDLEVAVRVPDAPAKGIDLRAEATGSGAVGGGAAGNGATATERVGASWRSLRLPLTSSPANGGETIVALDVDPSRAASLEIGPIAARPVMIWRARLRHGAAGAVLGALLVLLCHPRVWRWMIAAPPPARDALPRDSARRLAGVGALIFLWFALWTFVKPIMHAPDEPHHLLRAEAIARTPWIAPELTIDPDPRRVNALAFDLPDPLWRLIPRVTAPLAASDVAAIARTPWGQEGSRQPVHPFRVAIASYPTLYYWSAFALAEPIVRGAPLSPYAAVWAYRLVTALISALLWSAIFLELRRLPETRALAPALLAFMLLTPMVSYLSGAVHTDGPSIALATLALLLAWRTLRSGDAAGRTCLVLLAGLFVKPSGVAIAGSLAVATVVVWRTGAARARDAARVGLAAAIACAIAYAAFYAWSPPVVFGDPATAVASMTPARYLGDLWSRAGWLWTSAWGMLGWVDLRLPAPWYAALLPLLIANGFCAWWRPSIPDSTMAPALAPALAPATGTAARAGAEQSLASAPPRDRAGFALFCFIAALVFTFATLAGEYRYATTAGYFVQGRYFLPVIAGLLPLFLHRVRALRGATLVYLGVMSLLLMRASVAACYADWATFWQSLPFIS